MVGNDGRLKSVAGKKVVKIAVNLSAATSTPMSKGDDWYSMAGWSPTEHRWRPAIRDKSSVVDQLSGPYRGGMTQ
jgi:hypothetical protein